MKVILPKTSVIIEKNTITIFHADCLVTSDQVKKIVSVIMKYLQTEGFIKNPKSFAKINVIDMTKSAGRMEL